MQDRRNPSRRGKRAAVAALALGGAALSARLAAYQLGWAGPPWEPFFGSGAKRVLRSKLARSLPFPDAALGVLVYLAEAAAVSYGGSDRWRTDRAAVAAYAATAGAAALGSAGLVLAQAAVVRAFCTLCLASAALSFGLAAPAWTETSAAFGRSSRACVSGSDA